MAKDPAFLFYSSDFLIGVSDLTMEERGQYITLMCLQHQKGHLSEKTIRLCLGSVSDIVLSKFSVDDNGLFFNERLEAEIIKRAKFTDSRRENGQKGGRPKGDKKTIRFSVGYPKNNLPENENENINIDINKKEIDKGCGEKEEEKVSMEFIKSVVDYLNEKVGTNYKHTSRKTQELIRARVNDGKFTLEDFKTVIDNKAKEWKNTDMAKYLRPETLFGTKFESYLNTPKNSGVVTDKYGRQFCVTEQEDILPF